MSLKIATSVLKKIRDHGCRAYPFECCGILLGRVEEGMKAVAEVRALENTETDSPGNRYLIDSRELLAADLEARRAGQEILGVYHSHPDHPPLPSAFDRERALPWYSYLIVSVVDGEPKELSCWVLREDGSGFDPETLVEV